MDKKAKYIFWSKAFLGALLLAFAVRTFWVETYLISSSQMEDALIKGDRVIVNKTAYGLRLPITPLSIPFTHDQLLGLQSYSSLIELPYHRINAGRVPLNDVVVFNHPLQTDTPLDKRVLNIGRCVAQPGDSVRIEGYELFVNGHKYQASPDFRREFVLPIQWQDSLYTVFHQLLKIPVRDVRVDKQNIYFSLNKIESYLLRDYLPEEVLKVNNPGNYSFYVIIPRKGTKIKLDASNLSYYGYLILQELGEEATLIKDKAYLNGKLMTSYTFKNDYYWILSDNQLDAIDSNRLGFISERNIVGKASFILSSFSEKGLAWDRFFSDVK